MPEWLKGADCKSAGLRLRWFESNSAHHFSDLYLGAFGLPFLLTAGERLWKWVHLTLLVTTVIDKKRFDLRF